MAPCPGDNKLPIPILLKFDEIFCNDIAEPYLSNTVIKKISNLTHHSQRVGQIISILCLSKSQQIATSTLTAPVAYCGHLPLI